MNRKVKSLERAITARTAKAPLQIVANANGPPFKWSRPELKGQVLLCLLILLCSSICFDVFIWA